MIDARVVPVLTVSDADAAERACRALLAGGLTTVEITFRTAAAADAIRRASAIEGLTVGAGTVLSEEQLGAAIEAGASFAVAPCTNPDVVAAARRAGIPFVPGAATPTEIDRARSLGCEVVKIFPAATVGGPAFLRAVSAVFPDLKYIPTGGITAENVADYLAVPSVLACGGTWITAAADGIEERARAASVAA
ncbi:MAG TPA: bifunctional 4-hydroxy-2-oxoglutarate aldolase/2-dehydro-3-deoxy-phosphogluconate aldolase [Gaiellaceae bacterium]|nr:bifunctional 4-hydroxy-2-oxoglutarate aldolase/2-dehydro-3-deoxy-phosphogluconate aldolase [Gaiellaceae bacterium]